MFFTYLLDKIEKTCTQFIVINKVKVLFFKSDDDDGGGGDSRSHLLNTYPVPGPPLRV